MNSVLSLGDAHTLRRYCALGLPVSICIWEIPPPPLPPSPPAPLRIHQWPSLKIQPPPARMLQLFLGNLEAFSHLFIQSLHLGVVCSRRLHGEGNQVGGARGGLVCGKDGQ